MDVVNSVQERDPQRAREPGEEIERVEVEEVPRG
jgi:hypothetical protein